MDDATVSGVWQLIGFKRIFFKNLSRNTCIHISIHFQIKKKCTELQLVCIHLVLFVTPCKTLDSVECTCVSLSIVRNADTLRGVAVARGSWWSPHSCITLATWRATNASGARRTRGSCSRLSWWPCQRDTEGEHSWKRLWHSTQRAADFTCKSSLRKAGVSQGCRGVI